MDNGMVLRRSVKHIGRTAFGCAVLIYPLKWLGIAPEPLSGWWVPVLLLLSVLCFLWYERMVAKLADKVDRPGDGASDNDIIELMKS